MEHRSLDHIEGSVGSRPPVAPQSRKERLLYWAKVLERQGNSHLQPLRDVEFVFPEHRRELRADRSALAVAFSDPGLRAAGLRGDTLGEAADFFGLSDRQAHHILCACHYTGRPAASLVASRVRAAARPLSQIGVPLAWVSLCAAVVAAEATVVALAI